MIFFRFLNLVSKKTRTSWAICVTNRSFGIDRARKPRGFESDYDYEYEYEHEHEEELGFWRLPA